MKMKKMKMKMKMMKMNAQFIYMENFTSAMMGQSTGDTVLLEWCEGAIWLHDSPLYWQHSHST